MGIADLVNRLRFGNEEYYDDGDREEYEEEEQEEYEEREVTPRRSTQSRNQAQTQTQSKTRIFARPKTQTQARNSNNMELVLVKPSSFEESKDICDHLLSGKTVVINMEGMHGDLARRIIDFVSGSAYSINGNLQKISNYIIVATPSTVELSGDFPDQITNAYEMSGFTLKV